MVADSKATPAGQRVFLSYSRKDAAFTRKLAEALTRLGYVADFDQSDHDPANIETGISAEDDWWRRLQEMIAVADAMILMVSPHSAASHVCGEEIAYARALGKRVVPVLIGDVDFTKAPPRMAALNVKLSFVDEAQFEPSLAALVRVLAVDVVWHREGSGLMALALKWEGASDRDAHLLSAGAVREAEAWAARRPFNAVPPGEPLVSYLAACRAAAEADLMRLRTVTGRAFVKPAQQAFDEKKFDAAVRIAAAGAVLADDLAMTLVPELADPLLCAAYDTRLRLVRHTARGPVSSLAFDPSCTDTSERLLICAHDYAAICDATSGSELVQLAGVSGWLHYGQFCPNGRFVAAAEKQGLGVWNTASGERMYSLRDASSPLAFNMDSTLLVSGSNERTASVWEVSSGTRLLTLKAEGLVSAVRFSPDGQMIATATGGGVAHLWDAKSGRRLTELKGHADWIHAAAFSACGSHLVTVSNDKTAIVWNGKNGKRRHRLTGHNGWVTFATFSPDGDRVVTCSADKTARVWDAKSGALIAMLPHTHQVLRADFSPDGARVATGGADSVVRLWDAADASELASMNGHDPTFGAGIKWLEFSRDGQRLASAAGDRAARIWDAAVGNRIATLRGHTMPVLDVAFSPDGSRAITSSADNTSRIWSTETGAQAGLIKHPHGIMRAQFDPRGSHIVTTSPRKHVVQIWDASTLNHVKTLGFDNDAPFNIAFDRRGERMAIECFKSVRVLEMSGFTEIAVFGVERTTMHNALALSPDGARAIAPTPDRMLSMFDVISGTLLVVLRGHTGAVHAASYNSSGTLVATAGMDGVRVWDAYTGEALGWVGVGAFSVAFSPDGRRLVASASTAHIFDVATLNRVAVIEDKGLVHSASFSPCGMRLITGSGSRVITSLQHPDGASIWDVSRSAALVSCEPSVVVTSCLGAGLGAHTEADEPDLLMRAAPQNVQVAALDRLGDGDRERAHDLAARLSLPFHRNCYLTEGQQRRLAGT